jgi:hypothetical protein
VHAADIDALERKRSRVAWVTGAVLILGAIGFMFARNIYPRHVTVKPAPVKTASMLPEAPPVAEPAPRPEAATAGSGGGKATDAQPAKEVDGLRLDIQTRGPCWVSATADGQRALYRLMDAGEHVQVDARDDVVLRAGDASNFQFAINGAAGRSLGSSNEPVTVHITRQNYQEFLSR